MEILSNISWKSLDDRVVAVNTENGIYYTMNGTASDIWRAVAEGLDEEAIVEKLLETYEVEDPKALRKDVDAQLTEWKNELLIK